MLAIGSYLGPDISYIVKTMHETVPNHVIMEQQQQNSGEGRTVFSEIINSPIPYEHKTISTASLAKAGPWSPAILRLPL